MEPNVDEALLERAHFRSVIAAFKHYKTHSLQRISKSEKIIEGLPPHHQRMLQKYKTYLVRYKQCVEKNNEIIQLIIKDVEKEKTFGNDNYSYSEAEASQNGNGDIDMVCNYDDCEFANGFNPHSVEKHNKLQHDVDKVQSVLKSLVRDWSEMGASEREQCYTPIINEILAQFPPDECEPSSIRVLVPGAGLGRLTWEVARRGYTCQGNEFSLYMLLASHFILNKCSEVEEFSVHPWLHQFVNNPSCAQQMTSAALPDVLPDALPAAPQDKADTLSMAIGDFLKVYTTPNEWECVATCFFIDCAPNVIEFIETIYRILKAGGVWINLGPLLYHYSDLPSENSIEPPYDILLDIIRDVGFVILKEQTGVKTKYAQNPNSMMQHEYDSVFFVCQKPKE